jgi:hypothetical protein
MNNCETLVIESVREDGNKFRPSDWIERISAMMANFGPDRRLHYASSVHPGMIDGTKCLMVDRLLEQENPEIFQHIMDFAQSNTLRVREYCNLDKSHR